MLNNIRTFSEDAELVTRRREQIARGAARVFVKKGYDHATVNEIAKSCALSKGNLYHYVGSKADILYLVMDRGMDWVKQISQKILEYSATYNPTEAMTKTVTLLCETTDELQDIILFSYQELRNLDPSARRNIYEKEESLIVALATLLSRGCASGEFRVDDIMMVAHDILMGVQMWAFRRRFLRRHYTLDKYIKKRIELILRLVRA